jgi:rhamnosyltransferase
MATETRHWSLRGDAADGAGFPVIASVTVTYNPEIDVLVRQLNQLPPDALKVIVDNASQSELLAQLRRIASDRDDVLLVENDANLGLAKALNQGADQVQARFPHCGYLLLLDQDTEPGSGGVESLLAAFQDLARSRPRLGCVGPRLIDENTGLEHGFHQMAGGRWVRRFPTDPAPVPVDNINGSGILMPLKLFAELGGLDETFFIDHVDTEWSFRVLASGRELFGIPSVHFKHRMGVRGIRYWFLGWRVWPYRSPGRHYYLFRNTVRLLRTPNVPFVWKVWAPIKLFVTLIAHLAFDSARWQQAKQMTRGLRAGFSSPPGR